MQYWNESKWIRSAARKATWFSMYIFMASMMVHAFLVLDEKHAITVTMLLVIGIGTTAVVLLVLGGIYLRLRNECDPTILRLDEN